VSGFTEHTIINKTTELFVKHFNHNMHAKDDRTIYKAEPPQAQQSIAARRLDTARQNNIINDKTKQHNRQRFFLSKPIAHLQPPIAHLQRLSQASTPATVIGNWLVARKKL